MGTTTNHALRYPEYTGPVAVPDDVKKLAQDVDAKMLATTGGSVTGLVNFSQSPNVPTPTVAGHAANKSFVESHVQSVSIAKSLVDAKGDLIVGTANDTVGRLPAGADGTLIGYDSTQASGLNVFRIGNLLTRNQASGGDALGNAVGFIGGGNPATREYITSDAHSGAGCIKVTLTSGTAPHTSYQNHRTTCRPGDAVTHDVWVKTTGTAAGHARPNIMFYRANGTVIEYASAPVPVLAGSDWTRSVNVRIAPAETVEFEAYLYCDGFTPGEYYLMDESSVHVGAGGQFRMPGYPIPGQATVAQNGAMDLSGTGLPEGKVTAAPGSTWLQTDSTTDYRGVMLWRKNFGTGATGWGPDANADTGWRDVTASAGALHASNTGTLKLARRGRLVIWALDNLLMSAATGSADLYASIPTGFRSDSPPIVLGTCSRANNLNYRQMLSVNSYILSWLAEILVTTGAGTNVRPSVGISGQFSYEIAATTAWPSSLPGSAA